MFGDDDNKKVFRDQVIGLLLITGIVIIWSYFFIPSPPQKTVKDNGNIAVNETNKQISENTAPLQSSEKTIPIKKEDTEKEEKQQLLEMGIVFPPEPEITNEEENHVTLSGENMDIVFTRIGARVKYLNIYLKPNRTDKVQIVPIWKNTPDKDAVYPFGLRFHDHPLDDELDSKRWDVQINETEHTASFSYTIPNFLRIDKIFSFGDSPFVVDVRIKITNLSSTVFPKNLQNRVDPVLSLSWG
ncbi:MAG: hypothetical protein ACP5QY_13875, partial [Candidatus Hydrogenedens sp.]